MNFISFLILILCIFNSHFFYTKTFILVNFPVYSVPSLIKTNINLLDSYHIQRPKVINKRSLLESGFIFE